MKTRIKWGGWLFACLTLAAVPVYADEAKPPVAVAAAVSNANASGLPEVKQLFGAPIVIDEATHFAAVAGELSVLFTEDEQVIFQRGSLRTVLSDEHGGGAHWLHDNGTQLYAFYWRKFTDDTGKQLFVSVSTDAGKTFSKPQVITRGEGILPEVSIVSDPSGLVGVFYLDERNQNYEVYFNHSSDGGKTWQTEDTRVDSNPKGEGDEVVKGNALAPRLFLLNGKMVALWQQAHLTKDGPMLRLLSREFDPVKGSWSAEQVYFEQANMGLSESDAILIDDKILSVSFLAGQGVLGAVRSPSGDWAISKVESADVEDALSSLQLVRYQGNAQLAYTLTPKTGKTRLQRLEMDMSSGQWKTPEELDREKDHAQTRSATPLLASMGDELLMVWEDYRDILGNVYVDVLKGGKTLPAPHPLTVPGTSVNQLLDVIVDEKWSKAWVLYTHHDLKTEDPNGVIAYQLLEADKGGIQLPALTGKPQPDTEQLKARLLERSNALWEARLKGEWEKTWEYMDPLYRLKFGKNNWLSLQGTLTFTAYTFKDAVLNLPFATVTADVGAAIPQQLSKDGQLIEAAPPKVDELSSQWGWFDGDWYFMPSVFFMQIHDY